MVKHDPEQAVLELIISTNRPYSPQLLADNLQVKGIKLAAVKRALDVLVEKNKICCKEFGKNKIYYPPQENLPVLTVEEASALGKRVADAKEVVTALTEELKGLDVQLSSLTSSLTIEELREQVAGLEKQVSDDKVELGEFRKSGVRVSDEEREKAESACAKMVSLWRTRRSLFKGVWDAITENMETKPSQLEEEIGIETDKAVGLRIEDFTNLVPRHPKRRRI